MKRFFYLVVVLAVLAVGLVSCARRDNRRDASWTPQPITGAMEIGTRAPDLQPALPASTPIAQATAALPTMELPTAAAPVAQATRDPNLVVITEADVLRAVTSGATSESGATLENVGVQFTADGRMILTAGRVGYGFANADNVTLVGRLVAVDGKLKLQTESITPRGMVTALIPTVANQALQQYTSKWYIEDVRTTEGQIELRVRP
jgi:hypothetical protein